MNKDSRNGGAAAYPKLLLIDVTRMGRGTATGELKSAYFQDWPGHRFMHVHAEGVDALAAASNQGPSRKYEEAALLDACQSFNPDVILYRCVGDHMRFHEFAMRAIGDLAKPYALWLMDDWPDRARQTSPGEFETLDRDLRALISRSAARFAISSRMAEAFELRYGAPFQVLRNGVEPEEWPKPRKHGGKKFLLRYAGSLAPDTTRDSVFQVAEAVEALSQEIPICFEVNTQKTWRDAEAERYKPLKATRLAVADLPQADYRAWLGGADAVLIAYNFDPATRSYLKYSFANKIPECLASGATPFVYGPPTLSSIAFMSEAGAAETVTRPDPGALKDALRKLQSDPARLETLADAARTLAFDRFSLNDQREALRQYLRAAARTPMGPTEGLLDLARTKGARGKAGRHLRQRFTGGASVETLPQPFDAKTQFEETQFVFELIGRSGKPGLMIDVGAHVGGSLKPFIGAGWSVLAFEPDPKNRKKLEAGFGKEPNLIVYPHAVSDTPSDAVSFFSSPVSSGISGLSAFHESHAEVARVRSVTLDSVAADHGLKNIDFLKIDVEGFEMSVLRGLDFTAIKPRVVLAEYEDGKTLEHGYDSHDIARFLTERGYTVYVSEWHPIERYGVKHSWRRIRRYPCDIPTESWGNLLGFAEPPSEVELARAIRSTATAPVQFRDQTAGRAEDSGRLRKTLAVLGNGPSLAEINPKALKGVSTLGMNAAYRHWRRIDWWPDYYACLDLVVGLSHKDAIADMIANASKRGIRKFLLRESLITELGPLGRSPLVVNFDALRKRDPRLDVEPLTTGSHAMLWAAALGFERIVLCGIDGRYEEVVEGARRRKGIELEIAEKGRNPNYYFEDYQQPGDRYCLPNPRPNLHLAAWREAARVVREIDVEVLNAGFGSVIDSFDFVKLDSLLAGKAEIVTAERVFSERGDSQRVFLSSDKAGDADWVRFAGQLLLDMGGASTAASDDPKAIRSLRKLGYGVHRLTARNPEDLSIIPAQLETSRILNAARGSRACAILPNGDVDKLSAVARDLRAWGDAVYIADHDDAGQARIRMHPCGPLTPQSAVIALSGYSPSNQDVQRRLSKCAKGGGLRELGQRVTLPARRKVMQTKSSLRLRLTRLGVHSPILTHFIRFGVHCLRILPRKPFGIGGGLVLALSFLLLGGLALPRYWPLAALLALIISGAAALYLAAGYGYLVFQRNLARRAAETARTHRELQQAKREISILRAQQRKDAVKQASDLETLRSHSVSWIEAERQVRAEAVNDLMAKAVSWIETERRVRGDLKKDLSDLREETISWIETERRVRGDLEKDLSDLREEAISWIETERRVRGDLEKGLSGLRDDATSWIVNERRERKELQEDLESLEKKATFWIQTEREERALLGETLGDRLLSTEANLRKSLQRTTDTNAYHGRLLNGMNASNAAEARNFSRRLSAGGAQRLMKHWAPALDQDIAQRQLFYMAHQICLIEDRCRGRLAGEIERAMLRLIALRSLKKERVEVLEIGALYGIGGAILKLLAGPGMDVRVTFLDPLTGYYGAGEPDPVTGEIVSRELLEENMSRLGLTPEQDYRIIQALSETDAAVEAARDVTYDYVLIDGDHSYEGVKRDFELYSPMVSKGGLVIFDDYGSADWPAIAQFADERLEGDRYWDWLGDEWSTGIARRRLRARPSVSQSNSARKKSAKAPAKSGKGSKSKKPAARPSSRAKSKS